jgi:hypothetical protein
MPNPYAHTNAPSSKERAKELFRILILSGYLVRDLWKKKTFHSKYFI